MKMKWLAALALTAGLAVAPVAWSATTGTLTFDMASGTVGPNDAIPVYLTLTLATGSTPLVTDEQGSILSGYDMSDLPDNFHVDASTIGQSYTCAGTFTDACGTTPPYDLDFFKVATQQPLLPSLNLQPGESVSFLFGTFNPANGPVAPGTYFQQDFGLELQLTDFSQPDPNRPASPDNTSWQYSIALANTCDNAQGACGFQRTVVAAVPEPETYAMLLTGLGVMGWVVRRRKRS